MRPRSDVLLGSVPGLEERSVSLACAVGCSWSARPRGVFPPSSAGPTTPPRFELRGNTPLGRQTGEPTVSHEGGNATDLSSVLLLKKESVSLACASAQERRRAARDQSDANLHKVGCSWSAQPRGVRPLSSAGPTTPPRFELRGRTPLGWQTGEPTVSHEGGNDTDSFFASLEDESHPLACASAQEWRRATRVQSDAIHHKVGCSWSARAPGRSVQRSAGPTTPPRFERCTDRPGARQTGEPTVSHEGGNGCDSFSAFQQVTRG